MDNNKIVNEWISLIEVNFPVKQISAEITNLEGPKIELEIKVQDIFAGKIRLYVYEDRIAAKSYTQGSDNTKLCAGIVLALIQNWHNAVDYFNKIAQ